MKQQFKNRIVRQFTDLITGRSGCKKEYTFYFIEDRVHVYKLGKKVIIINLKKFTDKDILNQSAEWINYKTNLLDEMFEPACSYVKKHESYTNRKHESKNNHKFDKIIQINKIIKLLTCITENIKLIITFICLTNFIEDKILKDTLTMYKDLLRYLNKIEHDHFIKNFICKFSEHFEVLQHISNCKVSNDEIYNTLSKFSNNYVDILQLLNIHKIKIVEKSYNNCST